MLGRGTRDFEVVVFFRVEHTPQKQHARRHVVTRYFCKNGLCGDTRDSVAVDTRAPSRQCTRVFSLRYIFICIKVCAYDNHGNKKSFCEKKPPQRYAESSYNRDGREKNILQQEDELRSGFRKSFQSSRTLINFYQRKDF